MERARDGAQIAKVAPHTERSCAVCLEPLGASYWITEYPSAAHERCIDWSRRAFPFARQASALLRIARAPGVKRPDLLRRASAALSALQESWPGDVPYVFERGRLIVATARRFTAEAPAKVRALL